MVGKEHTVVGPHVRVHFMSPEDVVLLDRRAIRWSQVVHSDRARCELHDNGDVVPIGNRRQEVALPWPSPGCRPLGGPRTKGRSKRASRSA